MLMIFGLGAFGCNTSAHDFLVSGLFGAILMLIIFWGLVAQY